MSSKKCDAAFKKEILLQCYNALEKAGFSRFSKFNADWKIDNSFNCWVGLNSALYPDRVELTLNVGLHVKPIEELFCEMDNGEYSTEYDRKIATHSVSVGMLDAVSDEEPAFSFSPEQDQFFISSECERLARLYSTAGLEYAKSIASYGKLAPLIKDQVDTLGGNPERYACCLYLMGCKSDAINFLLEFPEEYKKYIKGFSIPFLKELNQ